MEPGCDNLYKQFAWSRYTSHQRLLHHTREMARHEGPTLMGILLPASSQSGRTSLNVAEQLVHSSDTLGPVSTAQGVIHLTDLMAHSNLGLVWLQAVGKAETSQSFASKVPNERADCKVDKAVQPRTVIRIGKT